MLTTIESALRDLLEKRARLRDKLDLPPDLTALLFQRSITPPTTATKPPAAPGPAGTNPGTP